MPEVKEIYTPNPKSLDGVSDLCMLTYLGEQNVLHNLRCRYVKQEIYTSTTAKVLVAINPYEAMPADYTEAKMKAYQNQKANLEGLADKNSLPPHLFWVSNSAYTNLKATKKNQSIIVCGESGAGKTESAKYMMRFLAFTTTSGAGYDVGSAEFQEADAIGQQILDANPILESFGNAKTLINNNSSRFGKFTKMFFVDGSSGDSMKLVGAGIDSYLLEKSRVCFQDKGERNYHIFYQLTHCHDQHPELKLGPATKFKLTSQSGCDTLEDLRYSGNTADVNWHKELEEAWDTLSVPRTDSGATYRIVAGILKLGNIKFADKSGEGSDITNPELVSETAELWGIDAKKLTKRLETRTLYLPGGKTLIKPLNQGDAEFNRDSMCRNIYNGLFRWVVWRINQVSFPKSGSSGTTYIGILDVFGFEIFENNSFEQFCINFANERLQQFFNYHVLQAEQELYQREALLWDPIPLPNNQDTIDLFTRKPYGIYAILDSTCVQPKGTDVVFTQNLFKRFKYHPKLRKVERQESRSSGKQGYAAINGFTIKHYAGNVLYNCADFLVKNSDASEFDTTELMYTSELKVAKSVLLMKPDGTMGKEAPKRSHKRAFLSTGSVFSDQLAALMKTLRQTSPYFVRCVKPNADKKPRKFVDEFVRPQLRCGGLIEALRIIKLGFPTRCKYSRVVELFGSILRSRPVRNLNARDFTQAVLAVVGDKSNKPKSNEFQMGLTAIFFRPGKQTWLTEVLDKPVSAISSTQTAQIREFLIKKRWVRAAGLAKGWLRTESFLQGSRFSKAAVTMLVMYRTFGRLLSSARSGNADQLERDRLEQARLKAELERAKLAGKRLKDMEAAKAEREAELERQRAEMERTLGDKDAETERAKRKAGEVRKEFDAYREKSATDAAKRDEQIRQQRQEIDAAKDSLRSAESDRDAAKRQMTGKEEDVRAAQRDLDRVRDQKSELERNLGAGKEEYMRQISQKDTEIAEKDSEIRTMEREKGEGKAAYLRRIDEKNAALQDEIEKVSKLEGDLRDAERKARDAKEDSQRQLASKDDEIAELRRKIKGLEDEISDLRSKTRSEAEAIKDKISRIESDRRSEQAKFDRELAEKDGRAKQQEAELTEIKEKVLGEAQKKIDAARAQVEAAEKTARIAKKKEAEGIAAAQKAVGDRLEDLEVKVATTREQLAVCSLDVAEYKRENEILQEKLDKKMDDLQKAVALEYKLQHQSEMNEVVEKDERKIKDLRDEVRDLSRQLEVAKTWRTKSGRGR